MTNTNNRASNTHGGARPKVREDDARGGARPGRQNAGRPPQSFTLKVGDKYYVARADSAGNGIEPAELWTVSEITRTHVKFASDSGDAIRLVR